MGNEQKFQVRNRPTQKRAQETFDLILHTAALLLEEVGFDKLNTNLICKHANITPPALYRYFSNKYSILEELGRTLMDVQNQSSFRWMEEYRNQPLEDEDLAQLLREQYVITKEFHGAKWIMRSLRSVPKLAQVRFDSHALMNGEFTRWYSEKLPDIDPKIIERRVRVTNEAGYALIEMLLDGDHDDADEVFADAAIMFTAF
ncbi:TetR/AcrR family transcriptional regulator [Parasphingorhabdus sp.]|uniref:TetR/AcrR family transcriptional regulator n=1 Tax=Parasphingorhabdus sp. TaxID=2709688 RepID=UPI0032677B9A